LGSAVKDDGFEDDEGTNGAQAEGTNHRQNLLQMASGVIILTDKGSGTAEDGIGTSKK
jgi:hypothetical protein